MQEIAPNVFVETNYPGVNVGAIATDEGLICIDAPTIPADAYDWLARLRDRTGQSVRYLILTDHHSDRAFAAYHFRTRVVVQERTQMTLAGYEARFPTAVLDSLSSRFGLTRKELNGTAVSHPQVSFTDQAQLRLGGRRVTLIHKPSATAGSLWVYLATEKVLFAGDSLVVDAHPVLADANTQEWLAALESLLAGEPEVETIVPGRGVLCGPAAATAVANYVRQARERVTELFRAGRPRADTSTLISEFLPLFPPPLPHLETAKELLQRQIKIGLDHLYDECKAAEAPRDR